MIVPQAVFILFEAVMHSHDSKSEGAKGSAVKIVSYLSPANSSLSLVPLP